MPGISIQTLINPIFILFEIRVGYLEKHPIYNNIITYMYISYIFRARDKFFV